jgi:hypothetical protein
MVVQPSLLALKCVRSCDYSSRQKAQQGLNNLFNPIQDKTLATIDSCHQCLLVFGARKRS